MSRHFGAIVVVLGMGLGACISLEGFSESDVDAGVEAGHDAASPEAGQPADSGSDVASGDGATPAFRCSALMPVPAFCTDFDQGTLASIFGTPDTAAGATLALDDLMFVSPGRSMRAFIAAVATGSTPHAVVNKTFGFAPTSRISVEMDMRMDSADGSSTNTVDVVMNGYALALFLGGSSAKIREGVPADGGGLNYGSTDRLAPPSAKWFHLSFVITTTAGAAKVVLAYDSVPQSAVPLVVDQYMASTWKVQLGLNFVGVPDQGRDMHFDNLVIDGQ
jgi:hypothetical protein